MWESVNHYYLSISYKEPVSVFYEPHFCRAEPINTELNLNSIQAKMWIELNWRSCSAQKAKDRMERYGFLYYGKSIIWVKIPLWWG